MQIPNITKASLLLILLLLAAPSFTFGQSAPMSLSKFITTKGTKKYIDIQKAHQEVQVTQTDHGHDVTTTHADGSVTVDHHTDDHERMGGEYRGPGVHGNDAHGDDAHNGDVHGSDAHGSDAHGSDAHGSDAHGGDAHGSDAHGGH